MRFTNFVGFAVIEFDVFPENFGTVKDFSSEFLLSVTAPSGLFHLPVVESPPDLPLDCPVGSADTHGRSLHVFGGECIWKYRQQGRTGCGAVGFGDFDIFTMAVVEHIEDVIVVC